MPVPAVILFLTLLDVSPIGFLVPFGLIALVIAIPLAVVVYLLIRYLRRQQRKGPDQQ